jgi:hypothetical protein
MDTKQWSDLPPEPDLQEHQRLISRASRESAFDTSIRPSWRQVGLRQYAARRWTPRQREALRQRLRVSVIDACYACKIAARNA